MVIKLTKCNVSIWTLVDWANSSNSRLAVKVVHHGLTIHFGSWNNGTWFSFGDDKNGQKYLMDNTKCFYCWWDCGLEWFQIVLKMGRKMRTTDLFINIDDLMFYTWYTKRWLIEFLFLWAANIFSFKSSILRWIWVRKIKTVFLIIIFHS